ncbi:MAG: hypothetical protein OEM02_01090 [Desulfobulbaceae bacterium]|nr:hypothetical protein [Desulfobulbaceae bacterium]
MTDYLNSKNFPSKNQKEDQALAQSLNEILRNDYPGSFFELLGTYKNILADNNQRHKWANINEKLMVLFKCGKHEPLDGPMIGVSMSIRDSDYFQEAAKFFGNNRSAIAHIEWMATCWNSTFAHSGIWMGKTFEPISKEKYAEKCGHSPSALTSYNKETTRIGRNFFRTPHKPNLLHLAGVPVLTKLWNLKDRPDTVEAKGFESELLLENLEKEKAIPYEKSGGLFLASPGSSVVPAMKSKSVYQLNYRWPVLQPSYPLTLLIDELVRIDEGIYLGQLVMATKHFSLGTLKVPFLPLHKKQEIGEPYQPDQNHGYDYGYQNNGFFLMIDPSHAQEGYADNAFPQLRPHPGERGYVELGYDKKVSQKTSDAMSSAKSKEDTISAISDWAAGWKNNEGLKQKFTTFCLEPSPQDTDSQEEIHSMLQPGESILQMLKRIQKETSAQTKYDDYIGHFEKLNKLFRCGTTPRVNNGLFQGTGKGYNTRLTALENRQWYGEREPCIGFDYYHGATLNLHWGFSDTCRPQVESLLSEDIITPSAIAALLQANQHHPNFLNIFWANIGRFIFPWAGKSYEKISGRKLSMLLDESDDLKERYPQRVHELKSHLASWPHYNLVKMNQHHHWSQQGQYAKHLQSGSWDKGMSAEDQAFWTKEAEERWIFGNNIIDSRILDADEIFRIMDMNYHTPEQPLQELSEAGPSPFVRQGYIFLGLADQHSILPMNNGKNSKKRVFQFHYRYPMIGGPVPIGACLDELVEIAQGLYLGQLIYSTVPLTPFHSSTNPKEYKYQLFGYFLLLDNDWEYHRQAIKFDTLN